MNGTTTRLRRGGWQTLWPAGLLALTWAGAAGAGYGDITAAELTQHIEAYRDQPSYLHDHPEVLRSLTPPQLAQAINIPVFNIWSEVTVYDQGIVLPVSIRIPGGEVLTRILNQPRFYLALDFKDIQGGHVNAAGSDDPAGYAVVDGKLSALEKTVTILAREELALAGEPTRLGRLGSIRSAAGLARATRPAVRG